MSVEEGKRPERRLNFSKVCCIPQRYVISVFGMLAILNAYAMRTCLSVAFVKLVKPLENNTHTLKECQPVPGYHMPERSTGEYDWSPELQGFIWSSFYIGYSITHIPGGILADKYGSKWVLSLGILSSAIFTALTPFCIEIGGELLLIIVRICVGFGEGTTFPALSVLLADWVPLDERGMLGALIMSGAPMGIIIANILSNWLLNRYSWPTIFYAFASLAVVWFFCFIFLCYGNPNTHPFIKLKEREYLNGTIGMQSSKRKDLPFTPFKEIFKSISFWALVLAQFGHDWAFYVITSDLSKLFRDIIHINTQNDLYMLLPFGVMWMCSIPAGIISDAILKKQCMSLTNIRKMMTGIAAFGPAVFLMAASYSGCQPTAVIVNFCICMALMGTFYSGLVLTPTDMSPNYTGALMAITNGIGALTGAISPVLTGWMTPHTSLFEWRFVVWVKIVILISTTVIYCIWGTAEVQEWNNPEFLKALMEDDDS